MPRVRAWHLWMWVTGPLHSSFFWCAKRVRYDETVIRHDYLPDSGAPRGGLTAPLTAMVEVVLCWPPRHCGSVPSSVLIARYFGSLRVRLRLRVRSVIVQRIGSGPGRMPRYDVCACGPHTPAPAIAIAQSTPSGAGCVRFLKRIATCRARARALTMLLMNRYYRRDTR